MDEKTVVFDQHVNGFARVEYLSVFVALLYAFAVAEFFIGWSKMLRNREQLTFSRDHLIFSFIYFWILILNWYILWAQIKFLDQGFLYFVITLMPIIVTYLVAVLFFPDFDKVHDLNVYFDKNYRIITLLTILFMYSTMFIQVWEEHLEWKSPFVIFRCVNGLLVATIAILDIKKLKWLIWALISIGLFLGSYALAFV